MSTGPTVLVTGAGSGLGAQVARTAAASGWRVGVLDHDPDAAARVAGELAGAGCALSADVRDDAGLAAALDRLAAWSGADAPDAAVCNAGIVRFGPLLEVSREDWDDVVSVNLTGTFCTARAVAARMARAGRPGSIVTVTSINGVAPGPGAGAYGATKAAVARLSEQMALEWGPLGIRVNAVAPGLIDAGMSEALYADPELRRRRAEAVPLGRLGRADDVADAVLYLLSERAAYVSGAELVVDGGVVRSAIANLPRTRPDAGGVGR